MIIQLFSALLLAVSVTNTQAQCVQSNEPALKAVSDGANRFANNFFKNVKGAELRLANKIFTTNKYELQPEFEDIMIKHFKSKTQPVDFDKPENAAKIINNWSANKTNNRITEIFKADDLRDVSVVLVNAVYFKGKWANKFNPEFTKLAPFYTDEKNWKNVSMMQRHGSFYWGRIREFSAQFIELPYESENPEETLSMFVILPDEINELSKIENDIEKINFTQLPGHRSYVSLSMPKFESESFFDLKSTLQKMGITEIFKNTADLPGILKGPPIKVNKIVQKSYIEVNEEGSEAAATTGLDLISVSAPLEFLINTPFIAKIVSKTTGTVIFSARITSPEA
ncbi:hypothetical protein G9C98_003435 [Cotesia typhae]|uniref:Serpin domain-containing protein n=1 Tax=Cotesia typhae TaxID=2053667 RepID=A0A8J5R5H4_9HYME|nr:hypothetical protein G9C98_003435 [Cotesia typhae]